MTIDANQNLTLEETLNKLDEVVNALEKGGITLEQSLDYFEKGIKLVNQGQQKLADAEQRIRILTNKDESSPLQAFNNANNVQNFSDEPGF